jgi:hypothetical protein
VPILSTFFGIIVRMFYEDHAPPHFHVSYAEHCAVIDLETGRLLAGSLPRRCAALVEEWRSARVAGLRAAWESAQSSRVPRRIRPL